MIKISRNCIEIHPKEISSEGVKLQLTIAIRLPNGWTVEVNTNPIRTTYYLGSPSTQLPRGIPQTFPLERKKHKALESRQFHLKKVGKVFVLLEC